MRKTAFNLTFLISVAMLASSSAPILARSQSLAAIARTTTGSQALAAVARKTTSRPTEQEWIVSEVVAAIAGIAETPATATKTVPIITTTGPAPGRPDTSFEVTINAATAPIQVVVVDHLWSPETYRPMAERLVRRPTAAPAPAASRDIAVRDALTNLTVKTLLDQNERVSALLEADMHAPDAHESAALLMGAFALRESASWFHDIRPSLSRMAAHLAVARALRTTGQEGKDGMLARAVLTILVGRQRDAMAMVEVFQRQAASDADQAWIRALRFRITEDWRNARPADTESVLERLEHARAVRERLDVDAFMDYLDTVPEDSLTDWQRIGFGTWFNVEAGNRFTPHNIPGELVESVQIWSRFHEEAPTAEGLIQALNERPAQSVVQKSGVQVLDWGTWAAHQQRHLAHALVAAAYHHDNRGTSDRETLAREFDEVFGGLTLYPIVLRWLAEEPATYERALARARPLVEQTPELVTQQSWSLLLEKPSFVGRPAAFPLDVPWFTPGVPAGTAFELGSRSLRPGCPRPPTRAQAARWAFDMPYSRWTLWSNEWLSVDGRPSLAAVRRALGPLLEYDAAAHELMVDYLPMPEPQQFEVSKALCSLVAGKCDRLGELLLLVNRETEALAAYERWASESRNRVGVSNGVTWLVRYYDGKGNKARAETLARMAADTGSARGLEELGEWLDRSGQYADAERTYRKIVERYPKSTVPLGTFLMRQATRTVNLELQAQARDLLRPTFPGGPEVLAMHALDAGPSDGVSFGTFGPRVEATGLKGTDIIVGVDGWRVHTMAQYIAAARFQHGELMTLTVWRDGRYQQVRGRVPERWLGARLRNHQAQPSR